MRTVLDLSTYAGADGADGADGQGVPVGGTTGQYLKKSSNADFDTGWVDLAPLLLAGGTMSGAIAMGTNKITGLGNPTADQDAVTLAAMKTVFKYATQTALLPAPQSSGQYASPGGNTTTAAPTQSEEIAFPIMFTEDWTATIVMVNCTSVAASSVVRLGLRADAGNGHFLYPGALITDFGTVNTASGTGQKTISINQAFTAWTPYWATATSQGGAPTMTVFNGDTWSQLVTSAVGVKGYKQSGITGPLSTFSSTLVDAANVTRVLFGKA